MTKLIGQVNEGLSPSHKMALEASSGKKIKEITKEDLLEPITLLLGTCYELLGNSAPKGMTATAKLLRDELKTYFFTYSFEEVKTAIMMGVTFKLCEKDQMEFPVISVANFCKFVHMYNDKIRKEAIHAQRKLDDIMTKEMEERKRIEGNQRLDNEILDCLSAYCENPSNLDQVSEHLRACYFRRIRERQVEKIITIDEMNLILSVADAQIKDFDELGKQEQHALRHKVDREKWDKDRLLEVKTRAQSIALKHVFDKQK